MSEKKKHRLESLSESDFLSFLYSERDREYSLSQYQGWSNWALAGALITVICTCYAICKGSGCICWNSVLYYAGGIMAFFLTYHSWLWLFKRERGIDFSKVRMLKEVTPYIKVSLCLLCSITSAIIIPFIDGFSVLFWLWAIIFIAYLVALIVSCMQRKRIIEPYPIDRLFPSIKASIAFDSVIGGLLGLIGIRSLRVSESGFASSEFEIAVCISAVLVILYVLFKVNTEDRVLRRLDIIIDEYLYTGEAKEITIRKIVNNRMGYGALEACSEEIKQIKDLMEAHKKDEDNIDNIIASVQNGGCIIWQQNLLKKCVEETMGHQDKIVELSKKLSVKLTSILKATPRMKDVQEFDKILNDNDAVFSSVERVTKKIQQALSLIEKKADGLVCGEECSAADEEK